jgi:hypothetical protein
MTGCILQLPAPESTPISEPAPAHQIRTDSQPVPAQPSQSEPKANTDWVEVGSAENLAYQIKRGSFRFDRDTSGNYLAVLMGRQIDLTTKDVYFVQWTVRAQDCGIEHGSIYAYGMDGKVLWSNDFVFSGGTIAATIAEAICLLARDAAGVDSQQPAEKAPKPKGQAI